jgi:hypothetical protein
MDRSFYRPRTKGVQRTPARRAVREHSAKVRLVWDAMLERLQ